MSRIGSAGTGPEIRAARALDSVGARYTWGGGGVLGRPDFLLPDMRVALFVDGCFWHGCPRHSRSPRSNRAYWRAKLARNRARDLRVRSALRRMGWAVVRVWEHDLEGRRLEAWKRALPGRLERASCG